MGEEKGRDQDPAAAPAHAAPLVESVADNGPPSGELAEAEQLHEAARDAGVELPSKHQLLSFYDRLRERFLGGIERHGGKLPEEAAKVLLLVADVFILDVPLI